MLMMLKDYVIELALVSLIVRRRWKRPIMT